MGGLATASFGWSNQTVTVRGREDEDERREAGDEARARYETSGRRENEKQGSRGRYGVDSTRVHVSERESYVQKA